MINHPGESPQGKKSDDIDWETIEAVTNHKLEPGKNSRLGNTLRLKEENGANSNKESY